jgi:hypothetical protein
MSSRSILSVQVRVEQSDLQQPPCGWASRAGSPDRGRCWLGRVRRQPHRQRPQPATPGCRAGSTHRGAWQLNNCYHAEISDASPLPTKPSPPSFPVPEAASRSATHPGPCGLSSATDYAKHLVTLLFGTIDIGGCALFSGHVENSDHHPGKPASPRSRNGQSGSTTVSSSNPGYPRGMDCNLVQALVSQLPSRTPSMMASTNSASQVSLARR